MDPIAQLIDAHPAHQPGAEAPTLHAARQAALETFQSRGFPSTRVEQWKYTSTKALQDTGFGLDTPQPALDRPAETTWAHEDAHQFVFVNGHLQSEWANTPKTSAITVSHWGSDEPRLTRQTNDAFSSLNLALVQDALHIKL